MKRFWPFFFGLILFIYRPARAAMVFELNGIDSSPSQINYDQEITVFFSFSGVSPPKIYYLAGAFQKEAGSNYFGYTFNNQWYKYGDDFANFVKVEIADSSFSGQLRVKPDIDSSGFKGTADYQLKLFRYCSSQTACGDTNSLTLKIIAPASPSPAASPTPPASPDPPDSGEGGSPSPVPTPSPLPTPQPSKIYRIKNINLLELSPEPVLGTQSSEPRAKSRGKPDWQLITALLLTGTGLVGAAAFIIIRLWRKN